VRRGGGAELFIGQEAVIRRGSREKGSESQSLRGRRGTFRSEGTGTEEGTIATAWLRERR